MLRCLFALAVAAPVAAFAQNAPNPLRYDYVSTNLVVPELDEIGIELEGSTAVTEDLVVFGRYLDYEPTDGVELQTLQIGVGHVWNIRQSADFMASVSYGDNEIERGGSLGNDEEGVILGAQVRGWASRRIELSGGIWLDNSRGSSTDTVLELGVQYISDSHLSYGGRIRADEDDTALFLGARFYFGASRRPP